MGTNFHKPTKPGFYWYKHFLNKRDGYAESCPVRVYQTKEYRLLWHQPSELHFLTVHCRGIHKVESTTNEQWGPEIIPPEEMK